MNSLPPHADNGNIPEKKCTGPCGCTLPATIRYFSRQKSGLKAQCKQCQSEYRAAYYAEHREEEKQRMTAYFAEHREELRQYSAKYRAEHPEEVRQSNARYNEEHKEERRLSKTRYNAENREERIRYKAKWHQEHREEQRQYSAEYNAAHHDERLKYGKQRRAEHGEEMNAQTRRYRRTDIGRMKHRAHENARRARKLKSLGSYTSEDLQVQYKNQKERCYYCQVKLGNIGKNCHADHIVPLSRGGSNSKDNIVLACATCNLRKNNKLLHEWIDGGRLL